MDKIKICELVDSFYPCVDGVMHAVNNYCKGLNKRANCKLIAPAAAKKDNYQDNFEYEVIRCTSISAPENYRFGIPAIDGKLKKRLKNEQFDILHTHSPFSVGRHALKLAKKRNVPLVATLHTKYHEDFNRTLKGFKPLCWFMMKYIMHVYNKADSVWVVGDRVKEVLLSYGYKGDIQVVKNGTDFTYPENAEQLIERINDLHDLENVQNVFIFVGRIAKYKNIDLIAKSLKLLKDRGESFKILVVGGGFDLDEYRNTIQKLGLTEQFIFVGPVSDRELLQAYYLRADLFLFPSIFDNGPLVCIESAAHKLPCLVIEDSCAAEGVVDGENGYLVKNDATEFANKIQNIIANKSQLNKVGEEAYKTLYRSWDTVCDEVLENYKKVIQNYKSKRENNAK